MSRSAVVIGVFVLMLSMPPILTAGAYGTRDSASNSAMIHEENSVVASILYIPVTILSIPYRLIDGILNPRPTTQSTAPPPAHRGRR